MHLTKYLLADLLFHLFELLIFMKSILLDKSIYMGNCLYVIYCVIYCELKK